MSSREEILPTAAGKKKGGANTQSEGFRYETQTPLSAQGKMPFIVVPPKKSTAERMWGK